MRARQRYGGVDCSDKLKWQIAAQKQNTSENDQLTLGESLSMIGKMLGHRKVQTTARYAHLARDSVKASAARIAESLRADLAGNTDLPCPAP